MIPSEKSAPRKNVLPTWLIFGVLGLAATACGLFLPQSLRGRREPTTGETPVLQVATPTKDSLDYNPPVLPDVPSPSAMFLRLGLGTMFVLILCGLTLWAGKRWVRPLTGPHSENKQLRVLESLSLGGRCSVYLLQAGEAKVLAGVDQAGIKALLPLPQAFDGALAELTAANGSADAAIPEAA